MALNYKDMVDSQKTLANQVRDTQRQQAQSAFDQGQRGIQEQLRQNRLNQQKNRQQLSEQSYLAQRQNQQGATSRGLGSSGLRDLGALQNQIQQGRAVNEITQMDSAVQREALATKLGLNENLMNAMNTAESQYLQSEIEADRFGLDQKYRESELLTQFAQMVKDGMPMGEIEAFLKLSGINLGDLVPGSGGVDAEGNPIEDTVGGIFDKIGGGDVGVYGSEQFDNSAWNALTADYVKMLNAGGGNWTQEVDSRGRTTFTDKDTGEQYEFTNANRTLRNKSGGPDKYKFSILGEDAFYTQEQAGAKINEIFKGKQYIGTGPNDIKIVPKKNNRGWEFEYGGKRYKTYNKAVEKGVVKDQNRNANAKSGK